MGAGLSNVRHREGAISDSGKPGPQARTHPSCRCPMRQAFGGPLSVTPTARSRQRLPRALGALKSLSSRHLTPPRQGLYCFQRVTFGSLRWVWLRVAPKSVSPFREPSASLSSCASWSNRMVEPAALDNKMHRGERAFAPSPQTPRPRLRAALRRASPAHPVRRSAEREGRSRVPGAKSNFVSVTLAITIRSRSQPGPGEGGTG
jgi:hypothetical protein